MTQEEYIDFDIEVCTSYPEINSDEVDWKVSSVSKCVSKYLNKESGNEENPESGPESENEVKEIEPEEITPHEALIFIDKLINLNELNNDEKSSLSSLKDRLSELTTKNNHAFFLNNGSNVYSSSSFFPHPEVDFVIFSIFRLFLND